MRADQVAAVEIDQDGRLHISPTASEFPYIYREAMEVSWDPERRSLHSPKPKEWGYGRWLRQILAAAAAQGVALELAPSTRWVNVPANTQAELSEAAAHAA
jgi:hypothetical protein